jgi:hypothetical protein
MAIVGMGWFIPALPLGSNRACDQKVGEEFVGHEVTIRRSIVERRLAKDIHGPTIRV